MTDHNHQSQGHQSHGHQDHSKQHDLRDKASSAYASSKATAKDAAHRATEGLESNPLAVLVGGLAVGALAGALLPRSDKEKELLAPVGKRLGETARQALAAAKDAGQQELDNAGLSRDAARGRGKDLLGGLSKALSSAGTAAAQAAKGQSNDGSPAGSASSGQGQATSGQGQQGGSSSPQGSAAQSGSSSPTPMQA